MVKLRFCRAFWAWLGVIVLSFTVAGCDGLLETPFPSTLTDLTASQNVGSLLGIRSDGQEFELHPVLDNAGNEYLVVLRWPKDEWTGDAAEKLWIFDSTLGLLREYPRSGEDPVRLIPGNPASDPVFFGRPVVADGAGNIVAGDLRFRLFDLDAPPEALAETLVAGLSYRLDYGVSAAPTESNTQLAGIDGANQVLELLEYPGLELGTVAPAGDTIPLAPGGYPVGEFFFRVMGATKFSTGVRFLVEQQSPSVAGRMHVFSVSFVAPALGSFFLDADGQLDPTFDGFTATFGFARRTHLTARGVVVDRGDGNLRRYRLDGQADDEFDTGDRQRSEFGFVPDGKAYYRLNLVQERLMRFRTWW